MGPGTFFCGLGTSPLGPGSLNCGSGAADGALTAGYWYDRRFSLNKPLGWFSIEVVVCLSVGLSFCISVPSF